MSNEKASRQEEPAFVEPNPPTRLPKFWERISGACRSLAPQPFHGERQPVRICAGASYSARKERTIQVVEFRATRKGDTFRPMFSEILFI